MKKAFIALMLAVVLSLIAWFLEELLNKDD
jgi:uncharacterized membrane protein YvlD (DUF360 family)